MRPRFGGTTNGHYLRKGDLVSGEQGSKRFIGWVCGLPTDKTRVVAIADATGKRLAQCSLNKVQLLRRSTGVTWEFPRGLRSRRACHFTSFSASSELVEGLRGTKQSTRPQILCQEVTTIAEKEPIQLRLF